LLRASVAHQMEKGGQRAAFVRFTESSLTFVAFC
jgi:hypothetical protein